MKKVVAILMLVILYSCKKQETFKEETLSQELLSLEGETITFDQILERYKGKSILIDIWASWCPDCIKGMPKVHKLQEKYELVYLFLSYDKSEKDWKAGIEKYNANGENFLIHSDWKSGKFKEFLDISWIPRYIVVGENSEILLYDVIEADDPNLLKVIKPFLK